MTCEISCCPSSCCAGTLLAAQQTAKPPVTWDEAALREWATPIAGLNVRPGHFSSEEYHKAPVDNLRTYPVYFPGREPAGYWEMLQSVGPKPLVEPATLTSDADWVRAGQRVFDEFDIGAFRVLDPQVVAFARTPQGFAKSGVKPRADGTLPDLRWIPTSKGVALGLANCAPCHTRLMPDGTLLRGAPFNETPSPIGRFRIGRWGASAVELAGDTPPMSVWRSWAAPWIKDDIHESLKTASPGQIGPLFGAAAAPGLFPRWNGSAFYPTKIPDLIGIKDRKVHRSHGDPSASRPWRSDAIRGARHLQRLLRFRPAPHAHRRAAARALPRAGRSALRVDDVHLFARAARESDMRTIRTSRAARRSSFVKAVEGVTRPRSTRTTG